MAKKRRTKQKHKTIKKPKTFFKKMDVGQNGNKKRNQPVFISYSKPGYLTSGVVLTGMSETIVDITLTSFSLKS